MVNVKIVEGERSRVQAYEGVCIGRAGSGLNENFTVRKISYGEGVERVFPLYSPMIDSIKVVRRGKVRRAKLYYLRGRRGKSARILERQDHTRTCAGAESGRRRGTKAGESNQLLRPHSAFDASRAPSASAASFAQTRSSCRREPSPQSVPATTFSRPTASAKFLIRCAISSGCSTRLVAWLTTPGTMNFAVRQLDVFPDRPFVLVAHIAGLEAVSLRVALRARDR